MSGALNDLSYLTSGYFENWQTVAASASQLTNSTSTVLGTDGSTMTGTNSLKASNVKLSAGNSLTI
jgi:hypothetical protein